MAAIMLQKIPTFYAKISEKNLFISATTFEKYIVCKYYCIAHHDDKTCSLPACKYHIILLGNVEELLKTLDTFCFIYQHVACLYTLFKYRFSGKVIAKSGLVFDNMQRGVDFNHRKKGSGQKTEHCKKETIEEKDQKAFIQLVSKDKNNADQWLSLCKNNWKSQKD